MQQEYLVAMHGFEVFGAFLAASCLGIFFSPVTGLTKIAVNKNYGENIMVNNILVYFQLLENKFW